MPATASSRRTASGLGELARRDAELAAERVLCRGFFMVSCIEPSSPRQVSQEPVQRTTITYRSVSSSDFVA